MNNSSKRLAIFAPDMVVGGAERSMLKLAGGLSELGYRVDLVLSKEDGPFLAEVPEAVRLVNLNASRVLTSLPALVRYLRREEPETMLSVLHANLVAVWAKRIASVSTRIVISERNTLSVDAQYYRKDLRKRLIPQLARFFYPWADAIIAVSHGVADDLANVTRISPERIRVVYNPIVTPILMEKVHEPLLHPWFKPGEPPVVLAVGRLTLQKDFATLIQAFSLVRQTLLCRLLILGEGEERSNLEGMVNQLGLQKDVSLPGFVSNPYPYMRCASVFVLSSRWEGLPGVLIEAMYCGVPLISTDCPSGPKEILMGGKYGRLVPVGDVNNLALTIVDALEKKISPPPQESWMRFEQEYVVNQYIDVLFGRPIKVT